jgi:hypothetical protein
VRLDARRLPCDLFALDMPLVDGIRENRNLVMRVAVVWDGVE